MREKTVLSVQDLNGLSWTRDSFHASLPKSQIASDNPLSPSVSFSKTGQYFRTTFVTRKDITITADDLIQTCFTPANMFHRDDVSSPEETAQGWQ